VGSSFSALEVITGYLDLTVKPSPLFIRLEGSLGIAASRSAARSGQFSAGNESALTSAAFRQDFARGTDLHTHVRISFWPGDFFIEGDGHACLWICLDVRALTRHRDRGVRQHRPLVHDISAVFCLPLPKRLPEVFTGCASSPTSLRVSNDARVRAARRRPGRSPCPRTAAGRAAFVPGSPARRRSPKLTVTGSLDLRAYTTDGGKSLGDYVFIPPVTTRPARHVKTPSALAIRIRSTTSRRSYRQPAPATTRSPGRRQPPLGLHEVAPRSPPGPSARRCAEGRRAPATACRTRCGSARSASRCPGAADDCLHAPADPASDRRSPPPRAATGCPRRASSPSRRHAQLPAGLTGKLTLLDVRLARIERA